MVLTKPCLYHRRHEHLLSFDRIVAGAYAERRCRAQVGIEAPLATIEGAPVERPAGLSYLGGSSSRGPVVGPLVHGDDTRLRSCCKTGLKFVSL